MAKDLKPIKWTEEELDEMSQATEEDMEDVLFLWRNSVNRWAVNLLVATLQTNDNLV